jgi:hypothetical protein
MAASCSLFGVWYAESAKKITLAKSCGGLAGEAVGATESTAVVGVVGAAVVDAAVGLVVGAAVVSSSSTGTLGCP